MGKTLQYSIELPLLLGVESNKPGHGEGRGFEQKELGPEGEETKGGRRHGSRDLCAVPGGLLLESPAFETRRTRNLIQ